MGTVTNISIVKGEDRTINLKIVDTEGEPYDLTGYTEITAKFPTTSGTALTKTYSASGGITVTSAEAGRLAIALTDTDTALLLSDDNRQDFELWIDKGTARRIVQFKKGDKSEEQSNPSLLFQAPFLTNLPLFSRHRFPCRNDTTSDC